ncbi:MAG: ZIP family metal transporter [Clostridia bacterium]|nr:ZIP family metal transporter [Clostridia bacterium]
MNEAIRGIMIPFFGTSLGAALVFFMRDGFPGLLRRALTGLAAGVMAAASIWSLLLPAIEQSSGLGAWAFVPAAGGFWLGVLFLLLIDKAAPRLCPDSGGGAAGLSPTAMLLVAVTIHNVPEGMAVGVVYAGLLTGRGGVTALGAMALALGIAIQNLPEGAIISMPLRAAGMSRRRAFAGGVLSGAVEPLGAALMLLLASRLAPAMPWCLSFAAGAMLYVVVEELIPGLSREPASGAGALWFAAGFTVMLALDVALG